MSRWSPQQFADHLAKQKKALPPMNAAISDSPGYCHDLSKQRMGDLRPRKKPSHPEREQQAKVISWWDIARLNYQPRFPVCVLYAVPNGGMFLRPVAAAWAKKTGLRAGACDLNLDIARGGFHGMRIEMKSEKGRVSQAQEDFHLDIRAQGYAVFVCWSSQEAIERIKDYLA